MTREVATEKLIELRRYCAYEAESDENGSGIWCDDVNALDMAISALREQEERSKGCEHCTPRQGNYGYSFAKDMPDADGPIATCIRFANTGAITLHSEAYSHDDSGAEICEYDSDATVRFCPMCGRRLEEV